MIKLKEYSKKPISFIALNIAIFICIIVPKDLFYIRLGMLLIFIIAIFWDYYKKNISFNKIKISLINFLLLIFFISTIPSFFTTESLFFTTYTFFKFMSFALIFIILLKIDFNESDFKLILQTFIFSIIITFTYGLLTYLFDFNLNTVSNHKYGGIKGRVFSSFFNPIYFGAFINIIFPYLIFINIKTKEKLLKYISYILIAASFPLMMLTYSRSSFLVFITLVLLILLLNFKKFLKQKFIILIVVIASIILSFTLVDLPEFIGSSIRNLPEMLSLVNKNKPEIDDASIEHRIEFNTIGLQIARDNPLTGIGFGSYINYMRSEKFDRTYPKYDGSKTHPHSSVVLLASETGFISLSVLATIFIYLGLIILYLLLQDIKKKKNRDLTIATLLSFSSLMIITIVSENIIYDSQLFTITLMLIGISINYYFKYSINKKTI